MGKKIEEFVTNMDDNVFALRNLPEVVKGTLFSRYSRNPKTLRDILEKEFLEDESINTGKAENFYERILIGYGDDSVAELGGAHLAFENVSIVAAKAIENARLGLSFLEKSTRYIDFSKKIEIDGERRYPFVIPPEISDDEEMVKKYKGYMEKLFDDYSFILSRLIELLKREYPGEGKAWEISIKAKAYDISRHLLPFGALTNVGVYGNGRALEYMLIKLYSHPLKEVNLLAEKAHNELNKLIAYFVKRANDEKGKWFQDYLSNVREKVGKEVADILKDRDVEDNYDDEVKIIKVLGSMEDVLVGILLESRENMNVTSAYKIVSSLSDKEKKRLLEAYIGERKNRRHKPGRAFELMSLLIEMNIDIGIYRDLQRHRVVTPFFQHIEAKEYVVPREIREYGLEERYREAMERAKGMWKEMKEKYGRDVASYVVPMGFKSRYVILANIRELYHLCELRSQRQGHPNYRRVAIKIGKEIEKLGFPLKFLDTKDYDLERLEAEKRNEERRRRIGMSE